MAGGDARGAAEVGVGGAGRLAGGGEHATTASAATTVTSLDTPQHTSYFAGHACGSPALQASWSGKRRTPDKLAVNGQGATLVGCPT